MSYYWGIIPLDDNENRGNESELFLFSTASSNMSDYNEGSNSGKPEFSVYNGEGNSGKDVIVSIFSIVAGSDENLVYLASDQEIESIISDVVIASNETEITFSGEDLEWGQTYYVQIFAFSSETDDYVGDPSSVVSIQIPNKLGSDEQAGINVILSDNGSTNPSVEITNAITNAIDYTLNVSTESDMSDIYFSVSILNDTPFLYSDSDPKLEYGNTYYFQIVGNDENGTHGIPSSIFSLFIPNISPPILKEEKFNWDPSVPNANSYILEISTTDDFSSIVFTKETQENSVSFSAEDFGPGTMYYWRVVPVDDKGEEFGSISNIKFFKTEGQEEEIVDIEGGIIVGLKLPGNGDIVTTSTPSFSWDAIEGIEKYEIDVALGDDFSQIMWSSQNISQSSVLYPSTGVEPLQTEKIYFWRVRGLDNNVAVGEFSNPFSFTISNSNTPVLTGPISGTSESILPYFTWDKINNAKSYGIIIGSNEDLSQLIFESNSINENQFQYTLDSPPLEYDTQYYWKVIAFDEGGSNLGDYSLTGGFKTPSGIIEVEFMFEGD